MKAIVLEQSGGSENLKMKEINKPVAKANEVLVAVKAIGINPVDYKMRSADEGLMMMYGVTKNVVLGWDISGVVVEAGSDVTKFTKGDKVFGMVNFPGNGSAYAEFVAAPESHLAKMPEAVSFEDAAVTTLAALTALQVLKPRIKSGDRVLIHAGSGGVGHFAIQMAKSIGAYVITTSSAKNKDFVLGLGADEFIDYRTQKFEEILSDIDFVLDGMGGEILMNSVKILKEGGEVLSLPSPPPVLAEAQILANVKNAKVTSLLVASSGVDMETLSEFLLNGTVKPHVSKVFGFDEMPQAHDYIASGRTVGKIVVKL